MDYGEKFFFCAVDGGKTLLILSEWVHILRPVYQITVANNLFLLLCWEMMRLSNWLSLMGLRDYVVLMTFGKFD